MVDVLARRARLALRLVGGAELGLVLAVVAHLQRTVRRPALRTEGEGWGTPRGRTLQACAPGSSLYVPLGHWMHEQPPGAEYVPVGQVVHALSDVMLLNECAFPRGHAMQVDWPKLLEYLRFAGKP